MAAGGSGPGEMKVLHHGPGDFEFVFVFCASAESGSCPDSSDRCSIAGLVRLVCAFVKKVYVCLESCLQPSRTCGSTP